MRRPRQPCQPYCMSVLFEWGSSCKMVQCFAALCNHRTDVDGCRMRRFPTDVKQRELWKALEAGLQSYHQKPFCLCHFKDPSDAVPSIFSWTKSVFSEPPLQKKRKYAEAKKRNQINEEERETVDLPGSPDEIQEERFVEQVQREQPNESENSSDSSAEPVVIAPMEVSLEEGSTSDLQRSSSQIVAVDAEESLAVGENRALSEQPIPHEKVTELERKIEELEKQLAVLKFRKTDAVIAEAENTLFISRIRSLEEELRRVRSPDGHPIFLFSWIESKDEYVSHYTGLPNAKTFYAVLNMFNGVELNYFKGWTVTRLERREQLFMTLMKLRRGCSNMDLAVRYGVDASTISNIFKTWLFALHKMLVRNMMMHVPSRFKNQKYLPDAFKPKYVNTRMVVDCTEVWAASPSLISSQNEMYSSYKHRITLKGCVAIAPCGAITIATKLYPGRTSDKELVAHSKILDCCEPGDQVMADKGFLILPLLPSGVTLNIPPFKETPQFTAEQNEQTFSIARARIHVGRAIQRIKLFQILNFIPQYLTPYASEVFQVCAALCNFRKPLIDDDFEKDFN